MTFNLNSLFSKIYSQFDVPPIPKLIPEIREEFEKYKYSHNCPKNTSPAEKFFKRATSSPSSSTTLPPFANLPPPSAPTNVRSKRCLRRCSR